MPKVEDLPRLRYCEMVLLESLRLYPPTWAYVRMAQEDDILPTGFGIPRGAKLYLCQYVVHPNRRYFPDPERFDPSRFTDEARRPRPKYAYFPFGGGPRVCISQSLAMVEGVLAIAGIANRFRLALLPGQTIVTVPGMTLHPASEVLMQPSRRSAGPEREVGRFRNQEVGLGGGGTAFVESSSVTRAPARSTSVP